MRVIIIAFIALESRVQEQCLLEPLQYHFFHLLKISTYTTAPKSVATAKTLKKFSEAAEADREPSKQRNEFAMNSDGLRSKAQRQAIPLTAYKKSSSPIGSQEILRRSQRRETFSPLVLAKDRRRIPP